MTETIYQLQAEIMAAKDEAHANAIIQAAPEDWRQRLENHKKTVFSIRAFHQRQKDKPPARRW